MKIRELLSTPDRWTSGCTARTAEGWPVAALDYSGPLALHHLARSWCLLGAIDKCYPVPSDATAVVKKVFGALAPKMRMGPEVAIIRWNDAKDRTFEEVKKLVDELDV